MRLPIVVPRGDGRGGQAVTVNLDAVTFLGSAGVHALAAAYRRAADMGIRLRVRASRGRCFAPWSCADSGRRWRPGAMD